MKITIKKDDAIKPLKDCAAVAGSRSTLPILSCVLLEAEGDKLKITSTNLDAQMECIIPATVEEEGSLLVNASRLLGAINAGSEEIKIEADKNDAKVSAGSVRFRLPGYPADEFHKLKEPEANSSFTLSPTEWQDAYRKVAWAQSTDHTRYVLNGVHLNVTSGHVDVVATNGNVLSITKLAFIDRPITATIPSEAAARIAMMEGDELKFSLSESTLKVESDSAVYITRLIEVNYPNYKQVIPSYKGDDVRTIKLDAAAFVKCLQSVGMINDGHSTAAKFEVTQGKVGISMSGKFGKAESDIEADVNGSDIVFLARYKYMLDAAKALGGELTIQILNPLSAILINSGIVIMPTREV